MSVSHLSVVRVEDQKLDSPAVRAASLYAEAQMAAFDQIRVLEDSLAKVVAFAADIAEGGDVYPAGVRDLCRRMSEDLEMRTRTLDAIATRALEPRH